MELDIVLSQTSVPILKSVCSALNFLGQAVKQALASQEQLRTLVCLGAQLLQILDYDYHTGQLPQGEDSADPLDDFRRLALHSTQIE